MEELNIHWKKWCWSSNSNTLATWWEELTHWKRLWCWERLKAGGWDGWMASPICWIWVWVSSRSWWWTGKPDMLQSMGSQRVGHDWATELTNSLLMEEHMWCPAIFYSPSALSPFMTIISFEKHEPFSLTPYLGVNSCSSLYFALQVLFPTFHQILSKWLPRGETFSFPSCPSSSCPKKTGRKLNGYLLFHKKKKNMTNPVADHINFKKSNLHLLGKPVLYFLH